MGTVSNNGTNPSEYKLGNNLKVLEQNDQIKELQTIIRDRWVTLLLPMYLPTLRVLFVFRPLIPQYFRHRNTSRSDFKFYADRLIRLVIEESLNQLPYSDCSVMTPTGAIYDGLKCVIISLHIMRLLPPCTRIEIIIIFARLQTDISPEIAAFRLSVRVKPWNKASEIVVDRFVSEKY